jgi:hypothetical protein
MMDDGDDIQGMTLTELMLIIGCGVLFFNWFIGVVFITMVVLESQWEDLREIGTKQEVPDVSFAMKPAALT